MSSPHSASPLRVLIVDDEAPFRRLLSAFLATADDIDVVGEAVDGHEAITRCAELQPDVVLMDIQMPGCGGVEATTLITRAQPEVCVLALTVMGDAATIVAMLRAGARGYLMKDTTPAQLAEHVRAVAHGGGALSPAVAAALISDVVARPARPSPVVEAAPDELTPGELEVVQQLALGKSNAEIASSIFVSQGTVKARLLSMSRKWQVSGRARILIAAAEKGLLTPG